MASRKKADSKSKSKSKLTDEELPEKPAVPQLITDTIKDNYMPYVMTVIVSRAIPEIDGFKPSQRKLLYTMYKMGLMTGPRTKSTNIVGQTMKLNPHGDASIYETMVRLTRGNASLLHPFIDSKGCFGKQYSRDMAYAAARYTEAKLDPFCNELFSGIDKDAVDFVPNYDNTMTEPVLFPTTFPNVLVSPNSGIAVGMASDVCSFNLAEICEATSYLLRHPSMTLEKLMEIMPAPDFSGGAEILYDEAEMNAIYSTGRGSVRLRSVWEYNKKDNCIEILEIPYSTTIEVIIKKLTDLYKEGRLKEVSDFRDEIDLNGFKLTIDLKRGVDPDAFMKRMFKITPLCDSFKCNFNILIDSVPKTMGVLDILKEWTRFRLKCYCRELSFDLKKKEDKLHLLLGLGKILLDIDKAIAIVRGSEKESDVVPNLCKAFGIDTVQAEYIAEIKLRHLNREYILDRIEEIESLQKSIAHIKEILADELKQRSEISSQLLEIKKKYGQPRRTKIIREYDLDTTVEEKKVESYPVHVVLTNEGYFKKITQKSYGMADTQALKDGDFVIYSADCDNADEFIFVTNMRKMFKFRADDFDQVKSSALGEFTNAKFKMENGEKPIAVFPLKSVKDDSNFIFVFENGKGLRVPASCYETKSSRKKLTGCYSGNSPILCAALENGDRKIVMIDEADRGILISSKLIPLKATRTAGGVQLVSLKKGRKLVFAKDMTEDSGGMESSIKKLKIPATPSAISKSDLEFLKRNGGIT